MLEELNNYTINVRVSGYDNFSMNVSVPAKDPDEAFDLACAQEFRYQDDDPFVLMVFADDGEPSALCTYPTLEEAFSYVGEITSGRWFLVKRDDEGGVIIKTSDDEVD